MPIPPFLEDWSYYLRVFAGILGSLTKRLRGGENPSGVNVVVTDNVNRLQEVKAMLAGTRRSAPRWWVTQAATVAWFQAVAIQLKESLRGSESDKFLRLMDDIRWKDKADKSAVRAALRNGKAFLEALASRLHDDDLRKYPND